MIRPNQTAPEMMHSIEKFNENPVEHLCDSIFPSTQGQGCLAEDWEFDASTLPNSLARSCA